MKLLKKALGLMALCAAGTLGLILLPSVSRFGLAHGTPPPQTDQPAAAPASDTAKKTVHITRAPVRTVEDTYSSFSAVAVDPTRNEIVTEDENRDQIVVYGRLDNTPAQAALTEPKRIIGGRNTKI